MHPEFAIFIREIQKNLAVNQKLGVHHIIALAKIRDKNDVDSIDNAVINRLLEVNAIRKDGEDYLLSAFYTEITQEIEGDDWGKILYFVNESEKPVKMRDIIALFDNRLTRRQVNNMVFNLVKTGELLKEGEGSATVYSTK